MSEQPARDDVARVDLIESALEVHVRLLVGPLHAVRIQHLQMECSTLQDMAAVAGSVSGPFFQKDGLDVLPEELEVERRCPASRGIIACCRRSLLSMCSDRQGIQGDDDKENQGTDALRPHLHASHLFGRSAWAGACSKGRSSRTFFTFSSASTRSIRFEHTLSPSTGAISSRAFATTSPRFIGLSVVPRTCSTRSLSCVPSVKVISTMATRTGISFSSSSSGTSCTLARSRRTAGSCMRALSCAA